MRTFPAKHFLLMGFSLLNFGCLLNETGDYHQIIILKKPSIPEVPSPAIFALCLAQKSKATVNSRVLTTDIFLLPYLQVPASTNQYVKSTLYFLRKSKSYRLPDINNYI